MTKARWKNTIMLVSAATFVLALFLAASGKTSTNATSEPLSAAVTQSSGMPSEVYEGVITDTHCGAKHSASIGMAAADCTRVCVHGGEKFALVDGDTVRLLQGEPAALKQVAGQRVRIVGTQNGNTISVESVRAI
jgi:hypothetical protein